MWLLSSYLGNNNNKFSLVTINHSGTVKVGRRYRDFDKDRHNSWLKYVGRCNSEVDLSHLNIVILFLPELNSPKKIGKGINFPSRLSLIINPVQ